MMVSLFSIEMRALCFARLTGIAALIHVALSPSDALGQTAVGQFKLFERPDAFPTLVNPSCSHCVDESKRRGDQLQQTDRVLAWIRGKYDGGAIPVRFFLAPYRVISDTYGVFVYDPDAGYMRGFEPSLDFRFHGWRNGVMVIRHKDGTLYSALSGKAFDGPRKGDQLKPVPTIETGWGDWLLRYPGTVAYQMFDKYQPIELPRSDDADSVATRGAADPRLPPAAEVLGVALEGKSRAYPLAKLENSGGVIADQLVGHKVFVLWYPPTRTAAIFAAELEDATEQRSLTLTADSQQPTAPFTDRETGSHWDIAGRALSGELKGKALRWLPAVQCRWFAWSAEYPETELYGNGRQQPAPQPEKRDSTSPTSKVGETKSTPGRRSKESNDRPARVKPLEGVIVAATDVTPDKVTAWANAGHRAVVLVLDESTDAEAYRSAASLASHANLDIYYWVEVARNKALAETHPRWMASLGMHTDWHERFPQTPLPRKDQEVAKAYPWVPIGYRESFDAHLARIKGLLARAGGSYRGVLLNDLQGGPASCGCGNLQCRWAIDYRVSATATPLVGDDVAVRFLAEVHQLIPDKLVIPVWMTECENIDLPRRLRGSEPTTGLCGSVPCAANTCPKVFAQQWSALVADRNSAVGLLVLQGELQRSGKLYADSHWVSKAVEYVDMIPAQQGGKTIPHERLWLVTQGYGTSVAEQAQARAAALAANPAAVLVALTRFDQSYEPRIISLK